MIIDDLGIERNSEFALEQVYNVIDSRYCKMLPLIVTTNLGLNEMKSTDGRSDGYAESCTAVFAELLQFGRKGCEGV